MAFSRKYSDNSETLLYFHDIWKKAAILLFIISGCLSDSLAQKFDAQDGELVIDPEKQRLLDETEEEFETFFSELSAGLLMNDAFSGTDVKIKRYFGIDASYGYSYKLWKFYHAGFQFSPLSFQWIRFRNYDQKPTPGLHDRERYFSANMKLHVFNRFRFFYLEKMQEKGAFIDLGAGYNFPYIFHHVTVDEPGDRKKKVITSGLDNRTWFDIFARAGIGPLAVKASYRLNRIFSDDNTMPDPPRLIFSVVLIFDAEEDPFAN